MTADITGSILAMIAAFPLSTVSNPLVYSVNGRAVPMTISPSAARPVRGSANADSSAGPSARNSEAIPAIRNVQYAMVNESQYRIP